MLPHTHTYMYIHTNIYTWGLNFNVDRQTYKAGGFFLFFLPKGFSCSLCNFFLFLVRPKVNMKKAAAETATTPWASTHPEMNIPWKKQNPKHATLFSGHGIGDRKKHLLTKRHCNYAAFVCVWQDRWDCCAAIVVLFLSLFVCSLGHLTNMKKKIFFFLWQNQHCFAAFLYFCVCFVSPNS